MEQPNKNQKEHQMKLNEDYAIRDDLYKAEEEGATLPIEILVGPYAGIVYNYKTVAFKLPDMDMPESEDQKLIYPR